MQIEQAKRECGSIDDLCHTLCDYCTSNDWDCPSDCDFLIKARKIGIDRLTSCYAKHDGDLQKVVRYIRRAVVK